MGLFLNIVDSMKPAIKWALKNRDKKGSDGNSNNRNVAIPDSLWNMKESTSDEKTRGMAKAISALLIKSDLAGESNIFDTIAQGNPIKGKIIRSYVASIALKRDETSVKKMFIQMLLDYSFDGEAQDHIEKIVAILGDDPATIKQKLTDAAAETFVSLDDSDFEKAISSII